MLITAQPQSDRGYPARTTRTADPIRWPTSRSPTLTLDCQAINLQPNPAMRTGMPVILEAYHQQVFWPPCPTVTVYTVGRRADQFKIPKP